MTELAGMCSYENLNKSDIFLFSFEVEDPKATAHTVVEATSWMDWWIFAAKSMGLRRSEDSKMLKHLFVAASTLWVNLI